MSNWWVRHKAEKSLEAVEEGSYPTRDFPELLELESEEEARQYAHEKFDEYAWFDGVFDEDGDKEFADWDEESKAFYTKYVKDGFVSYIQELWEEREEYKEQENE